MDDRMDDGEDGLLTLKSRHNKNSCLRPHTHINSQFHRKSRHCVLDSFGRPIRICQTTQFIRVTAGKPGFSTTVQEYRTMMAAPTGSLASASQVL